MRDIPDKVLRFPSGGLSDATGMPQRGGEYYTPACVNVISSIPGRPMFLGGARPGLENLADTSLGRISGIYVVPWKTESGEMKETVAVVSGGVLGIVGETSAKGYAVTGDGLRITTDDGRTLVFSEPSAVMSSGRLGGSCAAVTQGALYYFNSEGGVSRYSPMTGLSDVVSEDAFGEVSMAVYRGRLCLFGKDNVIHASSVLDPGDFDSGAHYETGTKANDFTASHVGDRGDIVTAIIPCSDNLAIVATRNSIWRLNGDVVGGSLVQVSSGVGIIGSGAWSMGDVSEIFFLSEDGGYFLNPYEGPPSPVNSVDGNGVRRDVHDFVDPDTVSREWMVSFDSELDGYLVFAVGSTPALDGAWLVDSRKAVWRLSFNDSIRPTSVLRGFHVGDDTRALIGCADGCIRTFWKHAEDDCGEPISSAVAVGPVVASSGGTSDAILAELMCAFVGEGVHVSVVCGKTSRDVCARAESMVEWTKTRSGPRPRVDAEFVFSDGWNNVVRPRVRGNVFALVAWKPDGRWEYEGVTSVSRSLGRIR